MIFPAACILYSEDSDFVRRARAYLRSQIELRHVDNASRLDPVLRQHLPAILLLDLRGKESRGLVQPVQVGWPAVFIICFGTLRPDPLRDADQLRLFPPRDV